VANPDRFIPQLIRGQFDDSDWNQAFDMILKRFQMLKHGVEFSRDRPSNANP
jgi:hypothetical protein